MKITIKQLQEKLESMEKDRDNFYAKYWDLKEKEDRRNKDSMFALKSENGELANQVRNLLEIIRWQIKPNTAESPFQPTKEQRDGRKGINDY